MSTSNSKVTHQVRITQTMAGIQQYFATLPSIVLGGTTYSPAALLALLQMSLDAMAQTSNAKAAWLAAVQTERNQMATINRVLRYVKAFVVSQFGDTQDAAQKLQAFGHAPRKAPSKDVEVKALAADKLRATRTARRTKSRKQKAKIKGVVAAPVSSAEPNHASNGGVPEAVVSPPLIAGVVPRAG